MSELGCKHFTAVLPIESVGIQVVKFDRRMVDILHVIFPLLIYFRIRSATVKGEDSGAPIETPDKSKVLEVCPWDNAGEDEVLTFLSSEACKITDLKIRRFETLSPSFLSTH